MKAKPTTYFEDDEIRIRLLEGTGTAATLVFTGIRHSLDGPASDEFISAASVDGSRHVIFISDLITSWYSRSGMIDRIVEKLGTLIDAQGITSCSSLGNSMGGYGAMLFSKFIHLDRTIAFSPQVSMDPDVIIDNRWKKLRQLEEAPPVSSLNEVIADNQSTSYFVFTGTQAPKDLLHLDLLENHKNLFKYLIPAADHSCARNLKSLGILKDVVQHLLAGSRAQAEGLLAEVVSPNTRKAS